KSHFCLQRNVADWSILPDPSQTDPISATQQHNTAQQQHSNTATQQHSNTAIPQQHSTTTQHKPGAFNNSWPFDQSHWEQISPLDSPTASFACITNTRRKPKTCGCSSLRSADACTYKRLSNA
ncbi:MAG: hypothetical protein K0U36_02090, partial [Alphaproteobacteria bacterium]|nr:hypothetical protein [Alphaproteobacteria bacterium]